MPLYLVKTLIIIFKVFLALALNLMNAKHVMLMHFEFKMQTIVFVRKVIMIIIMMKQFAINARELGTQIIQIIFIIYKIFSKNCTSYASCSACDEDMHRKANPSPFCFCEDGFYDDEIN